MHIVCDKPKLTMQVKTVGTPQQKHGYVLTQIETARVQEVAMQCFSMLAESSYIRTTPSQESWLVFHFNGYNIEGKIKLRAVW